MPFQPEVEQELIIDGISYRIAAHPAAPGLPYGQEGRQATVYQVVAADGTRRALKVFKPRFRLPALVGLTERLAAYADLPGLAVCRRAVLTVYRQPDLLRQHPDLTYAVLMPWIDGPTWVEVALAKRVLTAADSLALARALADVLARMEEQGLAHCDLSGPNVLLPALAAAPGSGVALVDVEQLYGPDLTRPEVLPTGSLGYAHRAAGEGLWSARADRFAGALLLAEMLGWCDERIRAAAWGESYFDPAELQQPGRRIDLLTVVLRERWGTGVASLLERAWRSDSLADCATFGEWLVALPERPPAATATPAPPVVVNTSEVVAAKLALARQLERDGQPEAALAVYREAQTLAPAGSPLAEVLARHVRAWQEANPRPPEPPVTPATGGPPPAGAGDDEAELASLFDDGLAASQRQEWARARELLEAVILRQPDYQRHGQRARTLLAQVDAAAARPRSVPRGAGRRWLGARFLAGGSVLRLGVAGLLLLLGLVTVGVLWGPRLFAPAAQPQGTVAPVAAVTSKPAVAVSTATPAAPTPAVPPSPPPATATTAPVAATSPPAPPTATAGPAVATAGPPSPAPPPAATATPAANPPAPAAVPIGGVLRTFTGHENWVHDVALAANQPVLATASADRTVRLWRASDGSLLRTLSGHTDAVLAVAITADGQTVASGADQQDRTVRLWRASDGALLRTLGGSASWVSSVAFSPDGQLLATGYGDNIVRIWRVRDGELLRTLGGHTNSVLSLAFGREGSILATGSLDGSVRIWRVTDGAALRTLPGSYNRVASLAFSPDEQWLAMGAGDNVVRLFRVSDWTLARTLSGHTDQITGVAFAPDGRMLASSSKDRAIRLWRVSDGASLRTLTGHTDQVSSIAFAGDGQTLASGSFDMTARLWRVT